MRAAALRPKYINRSACLRPAGYVTVNLVIFDMLSGQIVKKEVRERSLLLPSPFLFLLSSLFTSPLPFLPQMARSKPAIGGQGYAVNSTSGVWGPQMYLVCLELEKRTWQQHFWFMDARSASVHVIFCRCFFYIFFYSRLSWPNG